MNLESDNIRPGRLKNGQLHTFFVSRQNTTLDLCQIQWLNMYLLDILFETPCLHSLGRKILFSRIKLIFLVSLILLTGLSHFQAFANDAYDPFIDYSEFDENGDEEADINFFKNGRLFSVGIKGGYSGFTGTLGEIYDPAVSYGLSLNFFFDLRFALQLQYIISSHNLQFKAGSEDFKASSSFNDLAFNLKYFVNTQKIIRDLALLNPYVIIGLSYVSRETAVAGSQLFDQTSGMGANIGGGIEYQLSGKKFYVGLEAVYNLVSFKDEGSEITGSTGQSTGIFPTGDSFRMMGTLGINF